MELKPDVLYEVAEPVPFEEEMHWLATGMLETMQGANGIGLAAPQVGESCRLIIGGHEELGWGFMIINPEIVKASEQMCPSEEGCLSFPDQLVKMQRHKRVMVKGFDMNWEPVRQKATGVLAMVLQHEIDHLDGKCIVEES